MFKTEFEYMEWVEIDIDGWHLKDGAPEEVIKAFEEYIKDDTIEVIV